MRIVYGGDIYIYIHFSLIYIQSAPAESLHSLYSFIASVGRSLGHFFNTRYNVCACVCVRVRACVYNQGKVVMVIIGLANNTSIGIKYLLP